MTDTPLLLDWAGNPAPTQTATPVTNRANTALYSPQGGIVGLGSDYGSTAKAQVPKVDAFGTQYVAQANPAGGAAQFYTGQPSPAASLQYGGLTMIRQDSPAPSQIVPLNADMIGSLNVHQKSKPTIRAIVPGITCAANKTLLALLNASTSPMVLRLNEINIYVPPSGAPGAILGSSGITYYPLICEARRISTASGGSNVTLAMTDSNDTLSTGVTVLNSPTTVSASTSTFHRQDAYISTISGLPFFYRPDPNEKSLVIRPGEAMSIVCVSSGTINNASGTGTTTAAVDIVLVFTQAPA